MNNNLVFFSKPYSAPKQEPELITNFKFEKLNTPSDLIDFSANPLQKKAIKSELAKGNRVLVLLDENRIIHYSCICFGQCYVGELKRNIEFGRGEGYIYNCFTTPEYRGKGLFHRALALIASSEDAAEFHICCLKKNIASYKAIENSGFIRQGSIKYLSILSVEFIKIEGKVRFKICK